MRVILAAALSVVWPLTAQAGCELVSGPCSTDRYGNTYRTEQNFGGGYNTYRNGYLHSQTGQTLSGSWRERFNDGSSRTFNYDPYESTFSTGRRDRYR